MKRTDLTRWAKNVLHRSGVIRWVRMFPGGNAPVVRMLSFHSVGPASADYCTPEIRVGPRAFERQIAFLTRHYRVISLDEAISSWSTGQSLSGNAVVITFDDGYLDNHTYAVPILLKYGATATFFVVSAAATGRESFWVGQLQRTLMTVTDIRPVLREFGLSERDYGDSRRSRQEVVDLISAQINRGGHAGRAELLGRVFAALGLDARALDSRSYMLTPQRIREMSDAGMTIGSHTATHSILTSLDERAALAELKDSKAELEAIVERPVVHFAYPNGPGVVNWSETAASLARSAGYKSACTSIRGMASADTDPFLLPRHNVNDDMRPGAFAFKLEEHRFPWLLVGTEPGEPGLPQAAER